MNIETWEGDDEEVDGETADAVRCVRVGGRWMEWSIRLYWQFEYWQNKHINCRQQGMLLILMALLFYSWESRVLFISQWADDGRQSHIAARRPMICTLLGSVVVWIWSIEWLNCIKLTRSIMQCGSVNAINFSIYYPPIRMDFLGIAYSDWLDWIHLLLLFI